MSLEVALQQNTEAVNRLSAILAGGGLAGPSKFPPPPVAKDKPKPDPVKEVLAEAPAAEEPKALTYKAVADKVLKVSATKGSATAKKVLEGFGVANLTKVDPKRWADVIAACDKVLS